MPATEASTRPMLLVSVRDSREALLALSAGVDLIDVKEPARGSLGPADPSVIKSVIATVAGRVLVSAAFGELVDFNPRHFQDIAGLSFCKLGLAGCGRQPGWTRRWAAAIRGRPLGAWPVAVVYADWCAAAAPRLEEIIEHAQPVGCRAMLVDTFVKDGRSLLDHWPLADLASFTDAARAAGLSIVLAGSLDADAIRRLMPLRPGYFAVRGAACRGGRNASLDEARMRQLVDVVKGRAPMTVPAPHAASKLA